MCGRYTITRNLREIQERFDLPEDEAIRFDEPNPYVPNYNVAPTETLPVVAAIDGRKRLSFMRWGLIPSWAKDKKIGARMINARDDTLVEKPAFRNLVDSQRCLVLADGFIEFEAVGKTKRPLRFMRSDKALFAFAGLFDRWTSGDESIASFTIITTKPNDRIARIHNRMPVMLPEELETPWISGEKDVSKFLKPYPADQMAEYYTSPGLNSVRNKSSDILDPFDYEPDLFSP